MFYDTIADYQMRFPGRLRGTSSAGNSIIASSGVDDNRGIAHSILRTVAGDEQVTSIRTVKLDCQITSTSSCGCCNCCVATVTSLHADSGLFLEIGDSQIVGRVVIPDLLHASGVDHVECQTVATSGLCKHLLHVPQCRNKVRCGTSIVRDKDFVISSAAINEV